MLLIILSVSGAMMASLQPLCLAPVLDAAVTTTAQPVYSLRELDLNNLGPTILNVFGLYASVNQFNLVLIMAILFVTIASGAAVLHFLSYMLAAWIGSSAWRDLQLALYRHMMGFSMGYFTRQKTGEVVSRFVTDTGETISSLDVALRQALQSIVQVLIYAILLFRTAPSLAVATLFVSLIHLGITRVLRDRIRRSTAGRFDALADVSSRTQESLLSIRVIKSFAAEAFEIRRFSEAAQFFQKRSMKFWLSKHAESPLRSVADAVAIGVVLLMAFRVFQKGGLTMSGFVLFVFLARQTIAPTSLFAQSLVRLQIGLGAARRILKIFESRPDLVDGHIEPAAFSDAMRLEKLSFAYQSDLPVIKDIDLEIYKGEIVAIVGSSGAGKSTLADLILRLYDPTNGRVTFDGTDIRQFKQESYRRLFGVVSQECLLFNATVRDNIAYGRPIHSESDILRAARIANAEEFINRLPQGYDTLVGDRGIRLSGGQRQRIAIARSIYGNPTILILDEATSSLDTESERLVQEAIDRVVEDMTAIVIAHRLSTVVKADKIVVMNDGDIEAVGPHEVLLEKSPIYRRLYELQFDDTKSDCFDENDPLQESHLDATFAQDAEETE